MRVRVRGEGQPTVSDTSGVRVRVSLRGWVRGEGQPTVSDTTKSVIATTTRGWSRQLSELTW